MLNMITFSQQDPRWSYKKMGTSNYTLGRYGCTTTCITDIYDWFFTSTMTPDKMSSKLDYTDGGYIIWPSLSKVSLQLKNRVQGRNDAVIQEALSNPNECVILEVNSSHWVWAIGRKIPILGYKISDPWDNKIKYTNSYGNNITGCAVITKI